MRPKYKRNQGSFLTVDGHGMFFCAWEKRAISLYAMGEYTRMIVGEGGGNPLFCVKKGREASQLINVTIRILNRQWRLQRDAKRKKGLTLQAAEIRLDAGEAAAAWQRPHRATCVTVDPRLIDLWAR